MTVPRLAAGGAPDAFPIQQIHRAHDGLLTFHNIKGDEFRNLCAISPEIITSYFPEFVEDITEDGYFSINGFYRNPKAARYIKGGARVRRAENVRWLNACWVDCDCYRVGLTWAVAVGAVQQLQDAGELPPASFLIRSGRGLWLMWLIKGEDDPTLGQRAHGSKVRLWSRVQHELAGKLTDLGADVGAVDSARITRVPGSINTKSGTRVEFLLQGGAGGRGISYTIDELAGLVGLAPGSVVEPLPIMPRSGRLAALPLEGGEAPRRRRSRDPNAPMSPIQLRGLKGWQALATYRLDDLSRLRELRGGAFGEGVRHNALLIYAALLWRAGYRDEELRRHIEEFNRDHLRPPLPASDVNSKAKQAARFTNLTNALIASWLDITVEESSYLTYLPAKGERAAEATPSTRRLRADRRHELIREFCKRYPQTPTLRSIRAYLDDNNVETCIDTIKHDLAALKIENPRGRGRFKQLPLAFTETT